MEVKNSETLMGIAVANSIILATVHFSILQDAYTDDEIFLTACEVVYLLLSLILGMDIWQIFS